jgi:hypothetical protein
VRIKRVEVEWFDSREDALGAEKSAIQSERPEYNVVHKVSAKQQRLAELAEETCAELTMRVTRFNASYALSDAAGVTGIRPGKIAAAMYHGDLPYYIDGDKVIVTGWSLIEYMEALQNGQVSLRSDVEGLDGKPIHSSMRRLSAALRDQHGGGMP